MRRWAEVSTGDFGLLMLPGGHFYLATQRDALLKDISVRIA